MSDLTIAERVANGVKFLDKNHPGWEKLIDLETFRIEHSCKCVIGQIVADYAPELPYPYDSAVFTTGSDDKDEYKEALPAAIRGIVMSTKQAEKRGFESIDINDYSYLQDEWETIIKERQNA